MTIYIYSNETGKQVAHYTGTDNANCEHWADINWGSNDYHWSYVNMPESNVSRQTTMKLNGYEAINYAETNGLTLNKYNDPIEDARQGLTPDEARKIAKQDPSLIYITLE